MADKAIYAKMIAESAAAADADLGVIGKKRGSPFVFKDAKPYVDAVNGMKPGAGQSKEVFDLHVQSVNAHYDILDKISVNNTIRAEDDPFVDPEWRLAHHMLRSSGFSPPWIERRQEMERIIEEAREALKRTWFWRQAALSRPAEHSSQTGDLLYIESETRPRRRRCWRCSTSLAGRRRRSRTSRCSCSGSKASVVMTNVAGPMDPLYLAGVPIDRVMFWVPHPGRELGMGISILSYKGYATLAVIADAHLVPDPEAITERFHREFASLQAAVRRREEKLAAASKAPRNVAAKTRAKAGKSSRRAQR